MKRDIPTHEEVRAAFRNWFEANDTSYGPAVRSFYKATGINSFLSSHSNLNEDNSRRVKQFAGPHGVALIKAYLAQQETGQ